MGDRDSDSWRRGRVVVVVVVVVGIGVWFFGRRGAFLEHCEIGVRVGKKGRCEKGFMSAMLWENKGEEREGCEG